MRRTAPLSFGGAAALAAVLAISLDDERLDTTFETIATADATSFGGVETAISFGRPVLGVDAPRGRHSLLTAELLAPAVQINGDEAVGSGTLIRSARDLETGAVESYVLTAWHVVRDILAERHGDDDQSIAVTVYQGDGEQLCAMSSLVAKNPAIDCALLLLDSDRVFEHVARVLPAAEFDDVAVWDRVVAVGCPLGIDPIATRGELCAKNRRLRGETYWMITAPTYYGNSGGGVFRADGRQIIGVFSKIYTHGGIEPLPVPHLGLITPITSIHEWLVEEGLAYVLG